MVKIKVLNHGAEYTKERPQDIARVHRNLSEELHPLARPREYIKALNAAKLKRHFSAPFVASLSGSSDGIYCMSRIFGSVNHLFAGSCDGSLLSWNLTSKKLTWKRTHAHEGFVTGVSSEDWGSHDFQGLFSCGRDQAIKMWKKPHTIGSILEQSDSEDEEPTNQQEEDSHEEVNIEGNPDKMEVDEPPSKNRKRYSGRKTLAQSFSTETHQDAAEVWISDQSFSAIDCSRKPNLFATAGSQSVSLWDIHRTKPKATYDWDTDTFTTVRFNPSETDLLVSSSLDRSIILYDVRGKQPIRKLTTKMRSSSIAWNPMVPYQFVVANEDTNLYTFDIRKFSQALFVHMDHIDPVLDVDFSPTGQEFVSGSYDRTIRIWSADMLDPKSREVYHTNRMQRIFAVKFSGDARFVCCGSEDHNVRVWKANASEKLDVLSSNHKRSYEAKDKLIEKFIHVSEIKKISKSRFLPKPLKSAKKELHKQYQAKKKRQQNRRKHEKNFSVRPATKEVVIREDE